MPEKVKPLIKPDKEETEKSTKVGYLSSSQNYAATFSINKATSDRNIWPLNQPLPVYLQDEQGNTYLVHVAEMTAPSTDLPSLSIIDQGKVILINPARNFILQSGLSTLVARTVQVDPRAIPSLMASVQLASEGEILDAWKGHGYSHLKLVAGLLSREQFTVFMQEYATRYATTIKSLDALRQEILRVLAEIAKNHGFFEDQSYLNTMRSFMREDSVAMLVEQKTAKIRTLLKDTTLRYGDLVSFPVGDDKYLMIVESIDALATLEPLVALEGGKSTMSFHPLQASAEGNIEGVSEVIKNMYSLADDAVFKVPVGAIPGVKDQSYTILLKGGSLIHFAIIAISGRGKGNFTKKFLLELLRQNVERRIQTKDDLLEPNGVGVILFDDAGEYVKCLKDSDWGLDIASLALHYLKNEYPAVLFVDVTKKPDPRETKKPDSKQKSSVMKRPEDISAKMMKIPVEHVPIDEVLKSLGEKVASDVIPVAMRHFYREHPDLRPSTSVHNRLSIEFINWFLAEWRVDTESQEKEDADTILDQAHFRPDSVRAARRALRTFIFTNSIYLGLKYSSSSGLDVFDYYDELKTDGKFNQAFNLLDLAKECADTGKILVVDESALEKRAKLFVQRVILDHVLSLRETCGPDDKLNPCLFIIEEATALMRESGSGQLDLYAEVAVKARKYSIGIGLIFQNVDRIDPILLQQLGWTVILGLPVDEMRAHLARNVPSDMKPYDTYVKRADIGLAIGIQQKLGASVTLPFKVNHYERDVASIFAGLKDADFEEAMRQMKEFGISVGVLENIKELVKTIKEEEIV